MVSGLGDMVARWSTDAADMSNPAMRRSVVAASSGSPERHDTVQAIWIALMPRYGTITVNSCALRNAPFTTPMTSPALCSETERW